MNKTFLAAICTAGVFASAASFANTSADTAPDRMPAWTAGSSPAAAVRASAEPFGVWEGGQTGAQQRVSAAPADAMQQQHAAATGRVAMGAPAARGAATKVSKGQPYADGAAN